MSIESPIDLTGSPIDSANSDDLTGSPSIDSANSDDDDGDPPAVEQAAAVAVDDDGGIDPPAFGQADSDAAVAADDNDNGSAAIIFTRYPSYRPAYDWLQTNRCRFEMPVRGPFEEEINDEGDVRPVFHVGCSNDFELFWGEARDQLDFQLCLIVKK